jgi:epoxyqueuosine reductase
MSDEDSRNDPETPEPTETNPLGLDDPSRRKFLTRTAVGGGAALAGVGAGYGMVEASIQGKPNPNYPEVDEALFKPKDQRDTVLNFAHSKTLNERHPERNTEYSRLHNKEFNFGEGFAKMYAKPWDNSKPGYTQMDRALQNAGWHPLTVAGSRDSANLQPDTPLHSWDQSDVEDEQFQFESKQGASDAIMSAARVFGAVKCGIARRDKRWDYDPLYDTENDKVLSWEEDFPFEPKSVIVMLLPQDYDAIATAPAWTADGTFGAGYTQMGVVADQMAKFLRGMGYKAVSAGNDLGISVAYAIMAGLGEGARNGALIAPLVGPRVRICKVYTEFEFLEYDEPHQWGITDFCKSCGKCAEACPAQAIPHPDDPNGGYGFEASYEHSDEEGYTWNNITGVEKFYSDAKKCYNFWVDNGGACGACIASCTFNEPDFWHHKFIMGITPYSPKPLHALMAKMHPAFGYGKTGDPKKVDKFWKTGEGMRVNPDMKNNIGTSNKS